LEALLVSTAVVALAEMGDKTQLLSFILAAKCQRQLPLILGIFFATLANHLFAGVVGVWLASFFSPEALRWSIALSFFVFGVWALKPDQAADVADRRSASVFAATLITFFIVEMGDKTQLATIALAAKYDLVVTVVLGTTFGMMIANVPAVWIGETLAQRVNMQVMRWAAAALFIVLGVFALFA